MTESAIIVTMMLVSWMAGLFGGIAFGISLSNDEI